MSAASFSSDAAQSLFEAAYATPALSLVKDCGKAGSSERIYSELGKMWAQTRKGLELLPPAQCHVLQEGRTLEEDLEDIVLAKNTEIWSELKSQGIDLKIGDTRLYNMPSTIRKKMGFAVQAAEAQRAADRAAAEAYARPPSIPISTPAKDSEEHNKPAGGLVAAILANIAGANSGDGNEDKSGPSTGGTGGSGNGSGGVRGSQVPPSLQNAAARLTTVGVTPLRKAAIGSSLATGFLQEHDTVTQWVRAQGFTGHSKREALTDARAIELGVADYGVGFLASSSAEVLLRRILALAVHSAMGSWQVAEKIEELPTESTLSVVPESLLKEIMEQVKNELKVACLAKQTA